MQDSTRAAEFDLIDEYFTPPARRDDVTVGVGDDAAVLQPPAGQCLVMTMDTLIAGVHFPPETAAEDVAYKCVAVNLSDLAAMGATPAWSLLSITLPDHDRGWLSAFSAGFMQVCNDYGVDLVGGDTARGPLSVTVQATGFVDRDRQLSRAAARPGDDVYVSGSLGDAALALSLLGSERQVPYCLRRLERPVPRVGLGMALAEVSRCAIDISDGLIADLSHILRASRCGAEIELATIPLSAAFRDHFRDDIGKAALRLACTAGDDYELCFTAAQEHRKRIAAIGAAEGVELTRIGSITRAHGIRCLSADGGELSFAQPGYSHF